MNSSYFRRNRFVISNDQLKSKINTVEAPTQHINTDRHSISMLSTTTGSGPGELIQRTIARDVHIEHEKGPIGKGRFGCVWAARWHSDLVAVKVFFSMHEESWSWEANIYQSCLIRHENILGFIAADIKGNGFAVNMLLITDYHPFGSLYDFLGSHVLDKHLLYELLYSTANGLNHLHQEIVGTSYKPAIVHRDLKTKNILVKKNLECCIADFGLAVRFDSQLNKMEYGGGMRSSSRVGSVRYMAPECLDGRIRLDSIEELKRTDVYAFSLVVWECLLRVDEDGVLPHRPPYFEHVPGSPDPGRMHEIVCLQKIRPASRFEAHTTVRDLI